MNKINYPQGRKKRVYHKLPVQIGRADFNKYVNPYLSKGKRGPKLKISRCRIFNYILYVLHTGIQWNQLKTRRNEISWQSVYHHHSRWSKDDSYRNLFETGIQELLLAGKLDLSVLHGDGSNTIAKKGAMVSAIQDTSIRKV